MSVCREVIYAVIEHTWFGPRGMLSQSLTRCASHSDLPPNTYEPQIQCIKTIRPALPAPHNRNAPYAEGATPMQRPTRISYNATTLTNPSATSALRGLPDILGIRLNRVSKLSPCLHPNKLPVHLHSKKQPQLRPCSGHAFPTVHPRMGFHARRLHCAHRIRRHYRLDLHTLTSFHSDLAPVPRRTSLFASWDGNNNFPGRPGNPRSTHERESQH